MLAARCCCWTIPEEKKNGEAPKDSKKTQTPPLALVKISSLLAAAERKAKNG